MEILIVGAGYAGLTAFLELKDHAVVTLLNEDPYHYFTTQLPEVVSGSEAPDNIRIDLDRVVGEPHRLVIDRAGEIDFAARRVVLRSGGLPYDYLILAPGSVPEFYGLKDVAREALVLTGLNDALEIRSRVSALPPGAGAVIVGGGLTGTELAAALADNAELRIFLLEAAPRLVPGFTPELSEYVERLLTRKGITIRKERMVTGLHPGELLLGDEVLPYDLLIWAAGVRGSPLASGLPADRQGRVTVDAFLHPPAHPEVYVAGDLAAMRFPGGETVPPNAQVAVQSGYWIGQNLPRRLRGEAEQPFGPRMRGIFANFGKAGAGRLGSRRTMVGLPAYWFKRLIEGHHALETGGLLFLLKRLWTSYH
ncbi:MAG: FAD-dependent oxidoreductase [Peptococcaceae bacterium]|jgi:NADH dehydrogenase|nr:FAD-dependent oxidoreductase [Peptococcaceae bacterium]